MRCRVTSLINIYALMTGLVTEMRKIIGHGDTAIGVILTTSSSFQSMRYW
jgi:hypothetical protein